MAGTCNQAVKTFFYPLHPIVSNHYGVNIFQDLLVLIFIKINFRIRDRKIKAWGLFLFLFNQNLWKVNDLLTGFGAKHFILGIHSNCSSFQDMKRKYILYLTTNSTWGGSEILWTQSAKKFADKGFFVKAGVYYDFNLVKPFLSGEKQYVDLRQRFIPPGTVLRVFENIFLSTAS